MKLYNFSDMRHALPASDSPVHRPASADNSLQGRKVVVILGPTGAGKSSLIKGLSGDERITVGDGLNSGTESSYLTRLNADGNLRRDSRNHIMDND